MFRNSPYRVPIPNGTLSLADRKHILLKGFFLDNDIPDYANIYGKILTPNSDSTSIPITIKLNRTHIEDDMTAVIDETITEYANGFGNWTCSDKLISTDNMDRDSYYTITINDLVLMKKLPYSSTPQNVFSLPDYSESF